MHPELAIVGYTTTDHIVTPSSHSQEIGGGAYFAALAASLIIQPVGLVTRVGEEFDSSSLNPRIMREGVKKVQNQQTTQSYLTYHSNQDPTDRDIKLELNVSSQLCVEDIPNSWKLTRFIHLATMFPAQQRAILRNIREAFPQSIITIDTDLHHFTSEENISIIIQNLTESDLVFLNRREYSWLKSSADLLKNVVVKIDKDGAFLLKGGKVVNSANTREVAVVDPTGAGDVFAGVYLAALAKGNDEEQALALAVQIATQSTTEVGIRHLLKQ